MSLHRSVGIEVQPATTFTPSTDLDSSILKSESKKLGLADLTQIWIP